MTHRNKRWQMRNGNQVLRDRYQKELAVVYPDNTMTFLSNELVVDARGCEGRG